MKLIVLGAPEFAAEMVGTLFRLKPEIHLISVPKEMVSQKFSKANAILYDADYFEQDPSVEHKIFKEIRRSKKQVLVTTSHADLKKLLFYRAQGACDVLVRPYSIRECVLRVNALRHGMKRVVCIGGGTGLFTLLMGIKNIPNTLVTSIVSMSDDGGSSGKLSQSFGVLPPGDVRRSLVALSNAPDEMNQIMQFRFDRGGALEGHSFGNLFLTALAQVKGSMAEAVRALSDILNIQGIVLPATATRSTLVARFENETVIRGESQIDQCEGRSPEWRVVKLWHDPAPEVSQEALSACLFAEILIIGPGDLYTSLLTNLLLPNLKEAISKSLAKKIYICNLMTKPGETHGMDAYDHVKEVVRYLGQDCLHYILVSESVFAPASLEGYAKNNQWPVLLDRLKSIQKVSKAHILKADLASAKELVRHDSSKLKHEIEKIIGKLYAKEKKSRR